MIGKYLYTHLKKSFDYKRIRYTIYETDYTGISDIELPGYLLIDCYIN